MALPLPRRPENEPRPGPQLHEAPAEPERPKPKRIARAITLAVAIGIWLIPPPGNLSAQAWHLFAIFAATILSVVIGALPILTASVLAVAAAVLSGTLSAEDGSAGF